MLAASRGSPGSGALRWLCPIPPATLTEPQGARQAPDHGDGVPRVRTELQQHRREGIPFALQLQQEDTEGLRLGAHPHPPPAPSTDASLMAGVAHVHRCWGWAG